MTEEETNIAVRLAACSRIAYITVLANSRTEKEPLRTLNLSNTTNVLMMQSLSKPVKLSEDDKQWLSRVRMQFFYHVISLQHLPKENINSIIMLQCLMFKYLHEVFQLSKTMWQRRR